MPFIDWNNGSNPTLMRGGRYELVYAPETIGGTFTPDIETARAVIGGRPGAAVDSISVDPFDNEIHAVVVPLETGSMTQLVPIDLHVVPADEWTTPVAALANLGGVEGWMKLDRWKDLGVSELDPMQVEEEDQAAREKLDENNVRNTVASVTSTGRGVGQAISGLAVALVVANVVGLFLGD